MGNYTPVNWYWTVGGKPNQVFSSASGSYVSTDDAAYVAFTQVEGNFTTSVTSDGILADVLAKAGLSAPIVAAAGTTDFTDVPPGDVVNALIAAGCQITSTGTPALNGTYAIDAASQQHIQAVSIYIVVNSKFPREQATMAYADIHGVAHTFPSIGEFQAFATALADYVAALFFWLQGGGVGSLPAQPVSIA